MAYSRIRFELSFRLKFNYHKTPSTIKASDTKVQKVTSIKSVDLFKILFLIQTYLHIQILFIAKLNTWAKVRQPSSIPINNTTADWNTYWLWDCSWVFRHFLNAILTKIKQLYLCSVVMILQIWLLFKCAVRTDI